MRRLRDCTLSHPRVYDDCFCFVCALAGVQVRCGLEASLLMLRRANTPELAFVTRYVTVCFYVCVCPRARASMRMVDGAGTYDKYTLWGVEGLS